MQKQVHLHKLAALVSGLTIASNAIVVTAVAHQQTEVLWNASQEAVYFPLIVQGK